MKSQTLLSDLLSLINTQPHIYGTLFLKNHENHNLLSLKKDFFILMTPWLKSGNLEIWNLSLKKLQERIQGNFNQKTRELVIDTIHTLLIESKRLNYQKLVAKSPGLSEGSINYFLSKNPSFEVLKLLCSHNKLSKSHFNLLWSHPRSLELIPILATQESLPQSFIYQLINTKDSRVSTALLGNPSLTLSQKLSILDKNNDPYLLLLFLEQPLWPASSHEFWTRVHKEIKNPLLRESIEVRLFYKNYNFPLDLLLLQKKFLKNQRAITKNSNLDKKIENLNNLLSKIPSSKAKLGKIF